MPTVSDTAEWAEIYGALFNRRLTDADARGFEAVICERIPNPVKGEVKAACMIVARDWQPRTKDGGYAAPPTAVDILRQMVRSRHDMAQEQRSSCDHCHDGWMSFRLLPQPDGAVSIHGIVGTVLHPDDEAGGMQMSCPCKCSRGDTHAANCKASPYLVNKLRDEVMRARTAYVSFRTSVKPGRAGADVATLAANLAGRMQTVAVG